jgi:hypothetical protein
LAKRRHVDRKIGDVVFSHSPLAEEMASVADSEPRERVTLRPQQDETFFRWRYSDPVKEHIFLYLLRGDEVKAYVVLAVSTAGLFGEILDYAEREDGNIREILECALTAGNFMRLSIRNWGLTERLSEVMADLGFASIHPLRRVLTKSSKPMSALPILVRPTANSFTDSDFFIKAVDVRIAENWSLKPFCSDAA